MDRVSFFINGEPKSVGCEATSELSLLDYLRVDNDLRGTKYMCREGGCGACIVTAERPGEPPHAVNSCLVAVTSCQDWHITTIEGVGNRLKGYHPVQKTLAKLNGTQCGYCSPGWVMAMYRTTLMVPIVPKYSVQTRNVVPIAYINCKYANELDACPKKCLIVDSPCECL